MSTSDPVIDAGLPWWRRTEVWFPLAVYAVTRLYVVLVVSAQQQDQVALPFSNGLLRIMFPQDEAPGYLSAMTNWDGQWYQQIATYGYPEHIPRTFEGLPDMSAVAFYPVFPMTTGALMRVTGLPFTMVGPIWSMLIGAVAMVLLFRLLDRAVGRWEAKVAVVAICTYVAAPVFSASYTESLALLVVVVTLMLIRARRYGWVFVSLLVLALSRNIVVAMAPVLVAHGVVAYRRRAERPFTRRQQVTVAALAVWAGVLTLLWPGIVGLLTGERDGYTQTMLAWQINAGKIKVSFWWNFLYVNYGSMGQVLGAAFAVFFAWFMMTPRSWRWGPEIWGWAGAYPAYLVLVVNTGPSRLRYAMLAFPMALLLAWALRLPERLLAISPQVKWWGLASVAALGLGQQAWYTYNYLLVTHLDGTIYFP